MTLPVGFAASTRTGTPKGTNVVVLDPDVARLFPNRQAVNETLRAVAQIVEIQERRQDGIKKAVARNRRAGVGRKS